MPKYVVALDQGTTSSRAMLVDANGCVVDAVQNPFPQVYPQPGWVEHDPRDILSSQLGALTELLVAHNLGAKDIDSIGITNQRETTVVWNRETGEPVMNAIDPSVLGAVDVDERAERQALGRRRDRHPQLERIGVAAPVAELHVHGAVVERSQVAARRIGAYQEHGGVSLSA